MIYSPEGRQHLTEACEGCPRTIYIDAVGVPTGGYGHTGEEITADMVGQDVAPEQADAWLVDDAESAAADVNRHVDPQLSQHQFDACVDFAFNAGRGAFNGSTLCRLINERDFAGADDEFGKWVTGGGHRLPGLVARRKLEAHWFDIPDGE